MASESEFPPRPRPKVLASVYACEPGGGSEEGNGWNFVQQLAKFADVWAVTRTFHKSSIEQGLQSLDLPNVHWEYYDFPWPDAWHRSKRFERIHYNLWQYRMYKHVAEPLDASVHFDICHHLTWAQYWSASYLCRLPASFVWGPVGGGESAPTSFTPTFSLGGKIYEATRDFARGLGHMRSAVKNQARLAQLAVASTPETAAEMEKLGARCVAVLPNAALPRSDFDRLAQIQPGNADRFRVISSGRLLHWKGYHLGLRAFADFIKQLPTADDGDQGNDAGPEYWILGSGPDAGRLKALAVELGIANSVRFFGRVSREEVLQRLAQCSVMLHPSLHDSAGWVPLEAGAAGLPVVCLNLGGSGQLVTAATGFKVEAINPDQAIADLSQSLLTLATDRELYRSMSQAGRQHVQDHHLWDSVGEYFRNSAVYQGARSGPRTLPEQPVPPVIQARLESL